jgi:hypothetical protein
MIGSWDEDHTEARVQGGTVTTRRAWSKGAAALLAAFALPRAGRAAPTSLVVAVPDTAVGAIVAAVGRSAVSIRMDRKLDMGRIRIVDTVHDVSRRILLKGAGPARARFLDDARNATKLGANVRDALAKALPERAPAFDEHHKAWSRPFAKKVLEWQARLARSGLRDKRVRDVHGRIYLLEWAGVVIDDRSKTSGPPALAKLPAEPASATLPDYARYIERLVSSVA